MNFPFGLSSQLPYRDQTKPFYRPDKVLFSSTLTFPQIQDLQAEAGPSTVRSMAAGDP